jgi:uncharacterized protein (TIGR00725 family)
MRAAEHGDPGRTHVDGARGRDAQPAGEGKRRPPLVGVCGAADATAENERDAEEVGRLLAERGAVVICGGFEGVMCAAARGAQRGGGLSIGVLAGDEPDAAAEEVGIALPTGLGELANAVLPRMVHGVIAIGQGYGTLTEVAHAIKLGRPVAGLGSWEIRGPGAGELDDAIHPVESAREAVDWLLDVLAREHHLPVSPPDSRGQGVVGVRQSLPQARRESAGGRGA